MILYLSVGSINVYSESQVPPVMWKVEYFMYLGC